MNKQQLIKEFDKLQKAYGSKELNSVYGGGKEGDPELCLVFINPTAKNIATAKSWTGIRNQWLGTKQVWNFLTNAGLLDAQLNKLIQAKKASEWTPEFCKQVYSEVANKNIYITNLAKCTQADAKALPDKIFKAYLPLFKEEIAMVNPKKIILFGNQVSSIILGQKISVSNYRKQCLPLTINNKQYACYPVYYPVGNGFFNAPKAIEDLIFISKQK